MIISTGEKPYSISFELRPDYLYARVSGDSDSYDISNAYWTEISEECAKHNVTKLLVDEDLAKPMESMSDVYHGASERSFMGLSSVKIAFVDRHPEHHEAARKDKERSAVARRFDSLTDRERDIVRLIADGHNNNSIADKLDMSEKTVRNRLTVIYSKLEVTSRLELALLTSSEGIDL